MEQRERQRCANRHLQSLQVRTHTHEVIQVQKSRGNNIKLNILVALSSFYHRQFYNSLVRVSSKSSCNELPIFPQVIDWCTC